MKEMKGRNDSMNGRIKITPKYLISLILIAVSVVLVYCLATMAWETAPMFEIQSKLDKYINYNVSGDQKGTLVQYTVRTGLLSEEKSTNQVEQEELNIELNQIDGKYPSDVKVLSKEDGDYNKEYNAENGLLTITTKDVKEFNVLCYYDTYTEGNEERALSFKVSAKIKVESEDEEINGDNLLETTVAENQGSLTSIDYVTGNIFNGKVKSNIINQTSFDTEYNEKMNVLIAKKEAQETIQITENNIYVKASQDENGEEQYTEIGNSQNLVYKSIKVGKQNLVDILGEEGTLQVLDSEGNVLAEINQETVYDENGYVTINYENEVSTIIIKTSEIKNEGLLKIENVKAIKASMTDIQNTKIKTTSEIKGLTQEFITDGEEAEIKVNENYKSSEENIVDIKDTKTDVKMEIDNTEWTNRQQNEVTFKINLNSNTVDKNLFKNPTLRIELPQEVEKVVLGNSSIMYGNGLQLVDPTAEKDENGKTVIVANLTGEQIQNNENALELSTEITIPATIILNKDLEVDGGDVKLTYTNNYTISGTPEVGDITTEVKFESYNQESLLQRKLTSTSPTATSNEESVKLEVTPVRGDVELADGDTVYEGEFIKYNVKATNTTGQDLQNVKVVATIPEGTTYAEYTSNFEQKRTPTKHEFNNELREKEITIGTLKAGESINKFYEVQVNDLNDNETEKQISTEIKIYSNNEEISKYNISNIVKPAEYKVYTYSFTDLEKDTYSIRVEVRGKSDENVNIKLKLPKEATPLYWADSDLEGKVEKDNRHEIDNLTSDKVLTITAAANRVYEVQVKIDETDLNKISEEYKFVATVNDTYVSNESRIEYKTEHVSINMTSSNEGEEVKNGDEIEYVINLLMDSKYITDSEDSAFTQINIKDCLPDEVIPVSITYPSNSVEVIEKKEIETDNEGNNQETKDYELKLVKGEEVTEELNDTVITDENGNVEPKVDFELAIPYNEPVTVKVKTIAGHVYEKTKVTNSATIEGVEEKASEAAIQNNDLEGAVQKRLAAETSNIVTHTILPYDYIDQSENGGNDADNNDNNTDNSGSQNGQTSFMVSGVVWNDQNEDGSQQSDEARIGDVETYLINAETGNIIENGTTKTNGDGEYQFSNIQNGKYFVVFKYDTNKYHPTEYQKNGVSSGSNSDAMQKDVTLQGKNTTVGITDIIELNNNASIDLGLIENKIFDLKIDKYISKVTVQTNKGAKQVEYNNAKLAKAEIRAKEMQGATVVVEYKIVVTNEGEIAGRATKVVDKLPNDLKFSSELNKEWVKEANGNITNTQIANREIKPGQSVELTLIATKTMTGESTGSFTNNVEIQGSTNAYNIKDNDSTDSSSKADLIVSVSTGAVLYTSIIAAVITIIAILVYLNIKFNIFSKIKGKKILVFIMLLSTLIFSGLNQSEASLKNPSYGIGSGMLFRVRTWGTYSTTFTRQDGVIGYCFEPNAYGGDYFNDPYRTRYLYLATRKVATGKTKMNGTDKIDLSKITANTNNKNTTVESNEVSENYILGPFKITNNRDKEGYTYTLLDAKGKTISGVKTCDKDGKSKDVKGTSEFYLKVPVANVKNGISKVKVTVKRSGTWKKTTPVVAREYWRASSADQGVYCEGNWVDENKGTSEGKKEFVWYPLGGLQIVKTDSKQKDLRLKDVEFEVTCSNPKYSNKIKTDSNGIAKINNLKPGTYHIKEVSNPYYGYDAEVDFGDVTLKQGVMLTKELKNEKKYINLSGIVWKDQKTGDKANTAINNKYENGQDELISNINDKVIARLVNKNTGETVKNKDGKECVMEVVDGKYRFEDVLVKDLANYNVIFTYNGFEYKDVKIDTNTNNENTSKAAENEGNRNTFNTKFANVEGTDRDTGKTNEHSLQYTLSNENESNTASLNKIDNGNKDGRDYVDTISMESVTNDSYINNRYNTLLTNNPTKPVDEITYINLGLYERSMPDVSLDQVLHNVKLTINGYEHTYLYENRNVDGSGEYTGGFNVGVKYGKNIKDGYSRAVYKSDWNTFNDKNNSNKLQMYMTYAISLNNESTGLDTEFNSIVDYYDSRYDIDKVGTKINTETGEIEDSISVASSGKYNDNYNKAVINLNGSNVESSKYAVIFIRFKLNDDVTLEKLNGQGGLKNIAEINGYSIYENGKVYAGIDVDSNPGNAIPGDKSTYEDDTYAAPDLVLQVEGERTVSGTVFEDIAKVDDQNIYEGNGLYDNGEKGINNVKVTLVDKEGNIIKTYNDATKEYDLDSVTSDENGNYTIKGFVPGEYNVVYTWGDETYNVKDYKATIFNEETHKVENRWWTNSSNDSDAKDDYPTRLRIDDGDSSIKTMNSITPTMNFGVENGTKWITDLHTTSTGDQFTPQNGFAIGNINFGIVRRPALNLSIEKRISRFKITYPNGQVLTDVKVSYNEDGSYKLEGTNHGLTFMPTDITNKHGWMRQEIDNELIQGSNLEVEYEIVVKNNSNKDYANINFYNYGKASQDWTNPVTITPTHITDYLDSQFTFDDKLEGNSEWQLVSYSENTFDPIITTETSPAGDWKENGEEQDFTTHKVQKYRKDLGGEVTATGSSKEYVYRYQKQVNDTELQEQYKGARIELKNIGSLEAGQTITKHLTINKVLANEDDISYDNEAEITEYDVKSGRIPDIREEQRDDWAEKIIITPATGGNHAYILPIALGISLLAIIGAGVVLIKKKVLNN